MEKLGGRAAGPRDAGKTGKARKQAKKAGRLVKKVAKRLASLGKGPKIVAGDTSRAALAAAGMQLVADLRALLASF